MIPDLDAGFSISCKCGHTAPFSSFTNRPVSGDLPKGHMQCPACNHAWTVRPQGKAKVGWSGMIIPPSNKVVELEPVM